MSRFSIKRPAIYIEEISTQPKPIEGVGTSTAAFLGETQMGPSAPTLVTSWLQYQSLFGGFFGADKYLPYAVEGFFLNGGQRCYVCKVTNGDYKAALGKLEAVEEVSIIYAPNAQSDVGLCDLLIAHCERLKRFCILDSKKAQKPSNVTKPRASAHAALYYPWIHVEHKGQLCLVPPGGHVAGIYARSDIQRGVNKAPANEVVNGAVKLEFAVTKSQLDNLSPFGVNCICNLEGRGIRVWGARTLCADPEHKYVNAERLLMYIELSLTRGTAWVSFEPNAEATWAKVRVQVENFLNQTWQRGMLMGAKPQEAYFVRCDRSTITQSDIDNARLNVLVGVAVIKPAEFMILHINQTTMR